MAFTATVTGASNRSSLVRGDVGYVSGTWTTSGAASGTIPTGGGTILGFDLTVGSAQLVATATGGSVLVSTGSAAVLSEKNKGGSGAHESGSIRVHEIDGSNTMSGDWMAIVRT